MEDEPLEDPRQRGSHGVDSVGAIDLSRDRRSDLGEVAQGLRLRVEILVRELVFGRPQPRFVAGPTAPSAVASVVPARTPGAAIAARPAVDRVTTVAAVQRVTALLAVEVIPLAATTNDVGSPSALHAIQLSAPDHTVGSAIRC